MSDRINLVIMHTHDTGRHLGVYGRGPETPNLERMAEEGVVFDNAFCSAPQCSPSRSSLFTGMMPHCNGLIGLAHRGFKLDEDSFDKHLAAVLSRSGYGTHLFGFQHECVDPLDLGYDEVHSGDRKKVAQVADSAVAFLKDAPDQPFFVSIASSETHRVFTEGQDCKGEVKIPDYLPDHPDVHRDINNLNYDAEAVDTAYGRVLEAIDGCGLGENTLVIYTTDHGIPFPGAKSTLFDPGIETALIMRGPGGFEGGKRIPALVSNIDVMPTILEVLGVDGHDSIEGKSLLPIVRGEVTDVNSEIFIEQTYHAGYDPMRGIRTHKYKYTRNYEPVTHYFSPNVDAGFSKTVVTEETDLFSRPRDRAFLFNLEADPNEMENLINEAGTDGVLAELRDKMGTWMKDTKDPMLDGFVPPPEGSVISRNEALEPADSLPAAEWLAQRES
jgi:N-sulfoglucosamine sulfohydrolase